VRQSGNLDRYRFVLSGLFLLTILATSCSGTVASWMVLLCALFLIQMFSLSQNTSVFKVKRVLRRNTVRFVRSTIAKEL
jgi:hypothetical protein